MARLVDVEVRQGRIVGTGARYHHVVDRRGQPIEEFPETVEVGGVEGCGAQGFEFGRCALKAFGIAAGEDDPGPLRACTPGSFEPDARAATDDDDGLPEEFRFALDGECGHRSVAGSRPENIVHPG